MGVLRVRRWCDISNKPISLAALHEKFPQPKYRVSCNLYRWDEAKPFGAAAREGLCFVLQGRCRFEFGSGHENAAEIGAGEYAAFPEGRIAITPLDGNNVEAANVWNLVELMNPP